MPSLGFERLSVVECMFGDMTGSARHDIDPFGSALQTVRDGLGQVSQLPTWSVSDDALPMLLGETRAAVAGLQELGCRLVAEADGRNLAVGMGGRRRRRGWIG